jgi:hypothetical protein
MLQSKKNYEVGGVLRDEDVVARRGIPTALLMVKPKSG